MWFILFSYLCHAFTLPSLSHSFTSSFPFPFPVFLSPSLPLSLYPYILYLSPNEVTFGSSVKMEKIQRRLAWPLDKDDIQNSKKWIVFFAKFSGLTSSREVSAWKLKSEKWKVEMKKTWKREMEVEIDIGDIM